MPKGYWIAHVAISDPDTYARYRAAVLDTLTPFGGRFLVRAGEQEVREGPLAPATFVVEFPSYADAIACYESPAYQQVAQDRYDSAASTLVVAEGVD